MVMLGKKSLVITLVAASIFSIFAGSWAATNASEQVMDNQTMSNQTTSAMNNQTTTAKAAHFVVRDSETVLLDGKAIGGNDYIHLYDTTPSEILSGHIAAKIPCDSNSTPRVQILTGSAQGTTTGSLDRVELETIPWLSTPGRLCFYHADVGSNVTSFDSDILIKNPSNSRIDFPATSTIVIGVNVIGRFGE
jgi:hypothetical protein